MACSPNTWIINTSLPHNPTWGGTLVINAVGTAVFTLNGGAPGSGSVNVHCGSDAGGSFMEFTNTHATPHPVHYHKAYLSGQDYKGNCDNKTSGHHTSDDDTWQAAPSSTPAGEGHHRGDHEQQYEHPDQRE
jgi:hypothetical protein